MIEKYFKELLFDNDCVVIPGFGGFLGNYTGAEFSISKNKISPPGKKFAFNEKLQSNDGRLEGLIMEGEHISIENTRQEISRYVQKLKQELSVSQQYTIEGFGRIYLNNDGNIFFDQYTRFNFLKESYGLPELYFKPIDRTKDAKIIFKQKNRTPMATPVQNNFEDQEDEYQNENEYDEESEDVDVEEFARHKKEKKTDNLAVYYVLAIVALIITAGTAYYLNMDKETYAVGSFNPMAIFKENAEVDSNNIENKLLPNSGEDQETLPDSESIPSEETQTTYAEETPVSANPAPLKSTSNVEITDAIESKTGRFFIIAGSFKNKRKAASLRSKLNDEGQKASIIAPFDDKNVYKVSINDYGTYDEAVAGKQQLKEAYGEDLWVLNY